MTQLDEARLALKHLARLVRYQDAEAARRATGWRLMERSRNREMLTRAVERLAALEATQQAETLEGSASTETTLTATERD